MRAMLLLLLTACVCQAQQWQTIYITNRTSLGSASAIAINRVVNLTDYEDVTLHLTCTSVSDTNTIIGWFSQSVDGTNYTKAMYPVGVLTGGSGVTVCHNTNLTVGAAHSIRLDYITNNTGSVVGTIQFRCAVKPARREY